MISNKNRTVKKDNFSNNALLIKTKSGKYKVFGNGKQMICCHN